MQICDDRSGISTPSPTKKCFISLPQPLLLQPQK